MVLSTIISTSWRKKITSTSRASGLSRALKNLNLDVYLLKKQNNELLLCVTRLALRAKPKEVCDKTNRTKQGVITAFILFYFAVETTHYNLTSVILQLLASDPDPYTPSAKFVAILPLYHIYGTLVFVFITRMFSALTYATFKKHVIDYPKLSVMRLVTFFQDSNWKRGSIQFKNIESQYGHAYADCYFILFTYFAARPSCSTYRRSASQSNFATVSLLY